VEKYIKVNEIMELINNKKEEAEKDFKKDYLSVLSDSAITCVLYGIEEIIVSKYKDTEEYIKVNEIMELINDNKSGSDEDYKKGKISLGCHLTKIGMLEVLRKDIDS